MGFFTKAVSEAVQDFPAVNAMIDGNEIVYSDFVDIGIAVSAPKGLVTRGSQCRKFDHPTD